MLRFNRLREELAAERDTSKRLTDEKTRIAGELETARQTVGDLISEKLNLAQELALSDTSGREKDATIARLEEENAQVADDLQASKLSDDAKSQELLAVQTKMRELEAKLAESRSDGRENSDLLLKATEKERQLQTDLQALRDQKDAADEEQRCSQECMATVGSQLVGKLSSHKATVAEQKHEIEQLQSQLSEASGNNVTLTKERAKAGTDFEELRRSLEASKIEVETVREEAENLQTKLSETKKTADEHHVALAEANAKVKTLEETTEDLQPELSRVKDEKDEGRVSLEQSKADGIADKSEAERLQQELSKAKTKVEQGGEALKSSRTETETHKGNTEHDHVRQCHLNPNQVSKPVLTGPKSKENVAPSGYVPGNHAPRLDCGQRFSGAWSAHTASCYGTFKKAKVRDREVQSTFHPPVPPLQGFNAAVFAFQPGQSPSPQPKAIITPSCGFGQPPPPTYINQGGQHRCGLSQGYPSSFGAGYVSTTSPINTGLQGSRHSPQWQQPSPNSVQPQTPPHCPLPRNTRLLMDSMGGRQCHRTLGPVVTAVVLRRFEYKDKSRL